MSEDSASQIGNTVGGDQAGGDIDKSTLVLSLPKEPSQYIKTLYAQFEKEEKSKPQIKKFMEELDYYNKPLDGDMIGLAQKLKDGNQENFIDFALRVKESYHKKLYKHSLSPSAQKINLHLLSMVECFFMHQIFPLIEKKQSSDKINLLIQELVVNPMMTELGENRLDFTAQDINGMLYLLTGNCHIKWKI
jgi:hypothetical protein